MKLGIIGAGHIGLALARLGVAAGHEVMLSNSRGPESLAEAAAAIGCTAGTAEAAARFGEVVVVTVPFARVFDLDPALLDGKIVVDTNNYYPERDGRMADLDVNRTTTAEMVAAHFAGARIVKAFNAILARDLDPRERPAVASGRRALPLAGDDFKAKRIVAGLHQEFGFEPYDAGTLAESWRFERAKPAYCIPLDRAGLKTALAEARRDVELPHGSWRRASA